MSGATCTLQSLVSELLTFFFALLIEKFFFLDQGKGGKTNVRYEGREIIIRIYPVVSETGRLVPVTT